MFLQDLVSAVVDLVFGDVVGHRGRRVHHLDECHAEVDAQTVDVEEAEERQQCEDKSTRRELYAVTPFSFNNCQGSEKPGFLKSPAHWVLGVLLGFGFYWVLGFFSFERAVGKLVG